MNASGRLNTCKSRGISWLAIVGYETGKRVRNTYATFPKLVDSPAKVGLIHRTITDWHQSVIIAPAVLDGRAPD